jgi:hypothetical protein
MITIADVIKDLYGVDDKDIEKLENRIKKLPPLEKLKLSIETRAMLIKTRGGGGRYLIGDKIYNKLIELGMKPDDEFLKRCHVSKPITTTIDDCNIDVTDLEPDPSEANLIDLMRICR